MNLFSVFRSSSAEVLFSKRLLVALYGLMAAAVLAHMASAYVQFLGAYYHLHQFDTPEAAFIFISVCLFLPFWVVGALMLRACIQRLRLELWVHKAIKVVAYNTPLRPAEAGFLVDYEYTHRELAATLVDLHFRHIIQLSIDSSIKIDVTQNNIYDATLSPYEQTLLSALRGSAINSFAAFTDPRLIALTMPAHEVLITDLTARHMIHRERLPRPGTRRIFRILYFIAGFVGAVSAYALIFQRTQALAVGFPRYPVSFSELATLIITALVVIGIIASSYLPRFAQNYKEPQYEAWIDAAGFMLYLRTVFTDRFAPENITTQDKNTLHANVPYALAYGIIHDTSKHVAQILSYSG